MASWKCGAYFVVAIIVVVLIILLNFDYLPKRNLSEELELTTKSGLKVSVVPTDGSVTKTISRASSVVEKDGSKKLTVDEYMKDLTNWSCTKDYSKMDNLPELSYEDVKKYTGNNFTWNNYCSGYPQTPEAVEENATKFKCYSYDDPFICVRDPLHCHYSDKSDMRFLRRPQYGEYKYLPKSLWLSVVLHGGVAFLYHPCARQDLINQLREMAISCLHRHVITPYERLSPCKPIAMVAWSCFYSTSQVNISEGKLWIRRNAMKGPASHVSENGQYTDGLKTAAKTVSDKLDTHLCPESVLLSSSEGHSHFQEPQQDAPNEDWVEHNRRESISIQNSEQVLIVNEQVSSSRKVDPYKAAWALGSLLFLCLVLAVVFIYTRPWTNRDHWWRVEDYNSNTKFSLMKTRGLRGKSRTFSRTFPNKKPSGYSRLLSAIPEEFEDDI